VVPPNAKFSTRTTDVLQPFRVLQNREDRIAKLHALQDIRQKQFFNMPTFFKLQKWPST